MTVINCCIVALVKNEPLFGQSAFFDDGELMVLIWLEIC